MLEQAQDEVRSLIRAYRHMRPQEDDTFGMVSSDTLVGAWDQLTGTIAAAAVGIVSVFMVVGGVVIMNIMLAVVRERTREIGVRKSVGARRQDILNQFLVESSMLSAMGGFIGVSIAWTVAILVRNFTPVPMEVPLNAVFIGVAPIHRGWPVLRNLSRAAGLAAGSYRCVEGGELACCPTSSESDRGSALRYNAGSELRPCPSGMGGTSK